MGNLGLPELLIIAFLVLGIAAVVALVIVLLMKNSGAKRG